MTDNGTTEDEKSLVDVGAAFVADAQTAELMQPTERTFYHPAGLAQTTAMRLTTAGQLISDTQTAQQSAVSGTAVGAIALNQIRASARSSHFAAHRWQRRQQRPQLTAVIHVGSGQLDAQRNALGIGEKMMFAARFAPVGRVGPRLEPPKTARTLLESTTARDQSSRSAACNRRSSSRWSLSHTPAFCQSRSRRQHVTPLPQPNSCGKSRQAMPLLSTNKIPVRAARSDTPLRPGNFSRRVFFGSSGAMIAHNESSTRGLAIRSLLQTSPKKYTSF
jgi:hypothetical protein